MSVIFPGSAKIQEWYQAAWFLSQKGDVDSKKCTVVSTGAPLKAKEVRIAQLIGVERDDLERRRVGVRPQALQGPLARERTEGEGEVSVPHDLGKR